MRKTGHGPSEKRRTGQRPGSRTRQAIRLKAIYGGIFIICCINVVCIVSLVERMYQRSEKSAKKAEQPVHHTTGDHRAITIEVLNGAGVSGIARTMTEYLRSQGFDVLNYGNAGSFSFYETLVLDRSGDRARAQRVARAIGAGTVLEQKNPFLALDVTMILGRDFRTLAPFNGKGEPHDR